MSFDLSQDEQYLEDNIQALPKIRDGSLLFSWCEQFLDIIQPIAATGTLNDIGAGMGFFLESMARRTSIGLDYRGFDESQRYVDKAREVHGLNCFHRLDISNEMPSRATITVVNALLEHIDPYMQALSNILYTTDRMVLLRTFLGPEQRFQRYHKPNAKVGYPINQYTFDEILNCFDAHGFHAITARDRHTDSMPLLIAPGIVRSFYVVIGSRR